MFFKEIFVNRGKQHGFSLPEMVIVVLIIAIIAVLVLPQVTTSRRLFKFSGVQRQVLSTIREARQEAMSQRTTITFRYNNTNKTISIFGGIFGIAGDSKNRVFELAGDGLGADDIIYGRPSGASTVSLGDGTNLTNLTTANLVDITFQSNGTVIDENKNPQNTALYFYSPKTSSETAFAVSVLGAGGRAKVWKYNQGANIYVE